MFPLETWVCHSLRNMTEIKLHKLHYNNGWIRTLCVVFPITYRDENTNAWYGCDCRATVISSVAKYETRVLFDM